MADLSKLSDEQLDELMAQKEAEQKAPDKAPQVDLTNLSDDELDELLELKAEEQIGTVEATARNFIQGATLGTSDEASAFVDAGIQKLTGNQEDFSKIYEDERNRIRERNQLAREAQPVGSIASEIAGGIATTGGIGGLAKNIGLGAVAGAGFSTGDTFSEIATDATLGSLLTIAGHGAMKGGSSLIKKAKIKLAKQPTSIQQTVLKTAKNEHPRTTRLRTATLKDAMNEKLDITDAAEGGFQDRVNRFIDVDAPIIVRDKIDDALKSLHNESQIILENNENVFMDVRALIEDSVEQLKQVPNFGDDAAAAQQVKNDFFELLQGGKLEIDGQVIDPRQVTFQQAQKIKTELDRMLYKNVRAESLTDKAKMFRNAERVNFVMNEFADNLRASVANIDQTGKLSALNERYSALYQARELMPQTAQDFISLLPGMGNSRTAQKARNFVRSVEAASPELAMDIVENLQPGMIQYQLAVGASSGMQASVSDVFRTKAIMGVNPALAPLGLSPSTQVMLANKVGRAGIKAFKLPRTISGMFDNQEMVVSKLSQINPSLAVVVEDALVDRDVDSLTEIMQGALEDPASASVFEPGLGFEGKLSGQEMLQMETQVKADSSLSTRQKLRAITQIRAGQIPKVEEEQQPFFKQYQPRPRNADGRKL